MKCLSPKQTNGTITCQRVFLVTLTKNYQHMKPFINYLIEANLSICFFLLVYQILLRNETDHRFNRVYLLLALVISVALPLFRVQLPSLLTFEQPLSTYWLPEIQVTPVSSGNAIQLNSFWFWISSLLPLPKSLPLLQK